MDRLKLQGDYLEGGCEGEGEGDSKRRPSPSPSHPHPHPPSPSRYVTLLRKEEINSFEFGKNSKGFTVIVITHSHSFAYLHIGRGIAFHLAREKDYRMTHERTEINHGSIIMTE